MPLNSRRIIATLFALTALTSAVFVVWPGLDLRITGWFFDKTTFPIAQNHPIEAFRLFLWDASLVVLGLFVVMTLASAALRRPVLRLPLRVWAYGLAVFLLGPGLLVNGVLKAYWGRARPFSVIDFGGDKLFSRAYAISDQCAANCSFVSGEVAGGTAMAVGLWLILTAWREKLPAAVHATLAVLILALPFVTGLQRVAAGNHFASDALLAGLFVALIAALLRPMLPPGRDLGDS